MHDPGMARWVVEREGDMKGGEGGEGRWMGFMPVYALFSDVLS